MKNFSEGQTGFHREDYNFFTKINDARVNQFF